MYMLRIILSCYNIGNADYDDKSHNVNNKSENNNLINNTNNSSNNDKSSSNNDDSNNDKNMIDKYNMNHNKKNNNQQKVKVWVIKKNHINARMSLTNIGRDRSSGADEP